MLLQRKRNPTHLHVQRPRFTAMIIKAHFVLTMEETTVKWREEMRDERPLMTQRGRLNEYEQARWVKSTSRPSFASCGVQLTRNLVFIMQKEYFRERGRYKDDDQNLMCPIFIQGHWVLPAWNNKSYFIMKMYLTGCPLLTRIQSLTHTVKT